MIVSALSSPAVVEAAGMVCLVVALVLLGVWLSGALLACILGFAGSGVVLVLAANARALAARRGAAR